MQIKLPPNPSFPLTPIFQGQNAAALLKISCVPTATAALLLRVTLPDTSSIYDFYATKDTVFPNTWSCWLDAYAATQIGQGKYELFAFFNNTNGSTSQTFLGSGSWSIIPCSISQSSDAPAFTLSTFVPDANDPARFHKLLATRDPDTGEWTLNVSETEYERKNGQYTEIEE